MKPIALGPAGLAIALCVLLSGCARNVTAKNPAVEGPGVVEIEHELDRLLVKVDHPERFPMATASRPCDRSGIERHRRGRCRCFAQRAGGFDGFGPDRGDPCAVGRQREEGAASDAGAERGPRRRILGLSAGAWRTRSLWRRNLRGPRSCTTKARSPRRIWKWRKTPRRRRTSPWKPPSNVFEVLGADKDHPTDVRRHRGARLWCDHRSAGYRRFGHARSGIARGLHYFRPVACVGICDVHENDLSLVNLGEEAEIRLNAYPNIVLKGHVSNIGAILDPNIRTAKVRVEVDNPG